MCSLFDLAKASPAAEGISHSPVSRLRSHSRSQMLANAVGSLPLAEVRFRAGSSLVSYFRRGFAGKELTAMMAAL